MAVPSSKPRPGSLASLQALTQDKARRERLLNEAGLVNQLVAAAGARLIEEDPSLSVDNLSLATGQSLALPAATLTPLAEAAEADRKRRILAQLEKEEQDRARLAHAGYQRQLEEEAEARRLVPLWPDQPDRQQPLLHQSIHKVG